MTYLLSRTCLSSTLIPMTRMTLFTEHTTSPKSTTSRNSEFPVSRSTNSNRDFGLIWICTEEFEFLDLFGFVGVPFSVESVIHSCRMSKFKSRFWFNLNLYGGIWGPGFVWFRGCTIFSRVCHTLMSHVQIQNLCVFCITLMSMLCTNTDDCFVSHWRVFWLWGGYD